MTSRVSTSSVATDTSKRQKWWGTTESRHSAVPSARSTSVATVTATEERNLTAYMRHDSITNDRPSDFSHHTLQFIKMRSAKSRYDLPTEKFFTGTEVNKTVTNVIARCMQVIGERVWIGERNGALSVWDVCTGDQITQTERKKDVFVWCIQEVGIHVWVGFSDGFMRVFDPQSLQCMKEIKEHAGGIHTMVSYFHERCVFTASADFIINQWDATTCERVAIFSGHTNSVRCLAMVGRRLFSGGDDGLIIEWDVKSGSIVGKLAGHEGGVRSLCNTSAHLWSASEDGSVRIWDLVSLDYIHAIRNPHTGPVVSVTLVGSKVWSASHGTIFVWDAESFELEGQFREHAGYISSIMPVHQALVSRVWSACNEGVVKMWDSESLWSGALRVAQDQQTLELEMLLDQAQIREESLRKMRSQSEADVTRLTEQVKNLEASLSQARQTNKTLQSEMDRDDVARSVERTEMQERIASLTSQLSAAERMANASGNHVVDSEELRLKRLLEQGYRNPSCNAEPLRELRRVIDRMLGLSGSGSGPGHYVSAPPPRLSSMNSAEKALGSDALQAENNQLRERIRMLESEHTAMVLEVHGIREQLASFTRNGSKSFLTSPNTSNVADAGSNTTFASDPTSSGVPLSQVAPRDRETLQRLASHGALADSAHKMSLGTSTHSSVVDDDALVVHGLGAFSLNNDMSHEDREDLLLLKARYRNSQVRDEFRSDKGMVTIGGDATTLGFLTVDELDSSSLNTMKSIAQRYDSIAGPPSPVRTNDKAASVRLPALSIMTDEEQAELDAVFIKYRGYAVGTSDESGDVISGVLRRRIESATGGAPAQTSTNAGGAPVQEIRPETTKQITALRKEMEEHFAAQTEAQSSLVLRSSQSPTPAGSPTNATGEYIEAMDFINQLCSDANAYSRVHVSLSQSDTESIQRRMGDIEVEWEECLRKVGLTPSNMSTVPALKTVVEVTSRLQCLCFRAANEPVEQPRETSVPRESSANVSPARYTDPNTPNPNTSTNASQELKRALELARGANRKASLRCQTMEESLAVRQESERIVSSWRELLVIQRGAASVSAADGDALKEVAELSCRMDRLVTKTSQARSKVMTEPASPEGATDVAAEMKRKDALIDQLLTHVDAVERQRQMTEGTTTTTSSALGDTKGDGSESLAGQECKRLREENQRLRENLQKFIQSSSSTPTSTNPSPLKGTNAMDTPTKSASQSPIETSASHAHAESDVVATDSTNRSTLAVDESSAQGAAVERRPDPRDASQRRKDLQTEKVMAENASLQEEVKVMESLVKTLTDDNQMLRDELSACKVGIPEGGSVASDKRSQNLPPEDSTVAPGERVVTRAPHESAAPPQLSTASISEPTTDDKDLATELSQLRRENDLLRERLAERGTSTGAADVTAPVVCRNEAVKDATTLAKENEELVEKVDRLERELAAQNTSASVAARSTGDSAATLQQPPVVRLSGSLDAKHDSGTQRSTSQDVSERCEASEGSTQRPTTAAGSSAADTDAAGYDESELKAENRRLRGLVEELEEYKRHSLHRADTHAASYRPASTSTSPERNAQRTHNASTDDARTPPATERPANPTEVVSPPSISNSTPLSPPTLHRSMVESPNVPQRTQQDATSSPPRALRQEAAAPTNETGAHATDADHVSQREVMGSEGDAETVLLERNEQLRTRNEVLSKQYSEQCKELERLENELAKALASSQTWRQDVADAQRSGSVAKKERDSLAAQVQTLETDNNRLQRQIEAVRTAASSLDDNPTPHQSTSQAEVRVLQDENAKLLRRAEDLETEKLAAERGKQEAIVSAHAAQAEMETLRIRLDVATSVRSTPATPPPMQTTNEAADEVQALRADNEQLRRQVSASPRSASLLEENRALRRELSAVRDGATRGSASTPTSTSPTLSTTTNNAVARQPDSGEGGVRPMVSDESTPPRVSRSAEAPTGSESSQRQNAVVALMQERISELEAVGATLAQDKRNLEEAVAALSIKKDDITQAFAEAQTKSRLLEEANQSLHSEVREKDIALVAAKSRETALARGLKDQYTRELRNQLDEMKTDNAALHVQVSELRKNPYSKSRGIERSVIDEINKEKREMREELSRLQKDFEEKKREYDAERNQEVGRLQALVRQLEEDISRKASHGTDVQRKLQQKLQRLERTMIEQQSAHENSLRAIRGRGGGGAGGSAEGGQQPNASEMLNFFTEREKQWNEVANLNQQLHSTNSELLTESTALASKLKAMSYIFETRPTLIKSLYELFKVISAIPKRLNAHQKLANQRQLSRSEAVERVQEVAGEVEVAKEGNRWIIANLFTAFELQHLGASPSMFQPEGRRPTWRDISLPDRYSRLWAFSTKEHGSTTEASQQRASTATMSPAGVEVVEFPPKRPTRSVSPSKPSEPRASGMR